MIVKHWLIFLEKREIIILISDIIQTSKMIDIRELEYKSLQYRQKKNQDQAEINVPLRLPS